MLASPSLRCITRFLALSAYLSLVLALPALAQTPGNPGVLYATTGSADGARLLRIDPASGAGALVGATGLNTAAYGLGIDSNRRLFATDLSFNLFRLDAASAAPTLVGPTGLPDILEGLAFDVNGTMYGVDNFPSNLYSIDPTNGVGTLIGPCGDNVVGLAIDPQTGILYASGSGLAAVPDGIFTVDKSSGALTLVGQTGLGGATPDITFDKFGNLYGVKGGGGGANNLISINKTTGVGNVIGPIGFTSVTGLAFAPPTPKPAKSDEFWASTGSQGGFGQGQILRIDEITGAGTLIGTCGLPGVPAIATDPKGNIFATDRLSGNLYRIDAESGMAILVGPTGVAFLDALAFDQYGLLYGSGDIGLTTLYSINPTTAVATPIGFIGEQIAGLAFDPTGGILYGSSGGAGAVVPDGIYEINTTTGARTLLGTTGLGGATPDLASDWDGNLYGVKGGSTNPSTLIAINKFTGAGTVVGAVGFNGVSGLTNVSTRRSPPNSCLASQGGVGDLLVFLDPVTGAAFNLGNMGVVGMPGLAIDSQGRVFGTSRTGVPGNYSRLYRIDAFAGSAVLIGDTGVDAFDAIAFDENDVLYGFGNWGDDALYTIDTETANATHIANLNLGVQGAAFDPTDGSLWITAYSVNQDEVYKVSKYNGLLTPVGQTGLGQFMQDIHFDALGRLRGISHASGGGGGNPSSVYDINKTTGAATLVGATGRNGLSGMASWPRIYLATQGTIYGSRGGLGSLDELLEIDKTTGTANLLYNTGLPGLPSLAIDSKGRMFTASFDMNLYLVSALGDPPIHVGPTNAGDVIEGLAFDANDNLYGVTVAPSNLFQIDPRTGNATLVGSCGDELAGLAFDPTTGVLWGSGAGVGADPDRIFTVNTATGLATIVGVTGLGNATPDICFDALGNLYGTKGSGTFFQIDKSTANGTPIGPMGYTSVSGLASIPIILHAAAPHVIYGSQGGAGDQIYRIDPYSGAGVLIGNTGIGNGTPALAIDSQGRIFGAARNSGDLYRVDALSGAAVKIAPTGVDYLDGLAFDEDDVLWGSGNAGPTSLYTIDPLTGTATLIGPTGEQMNGLAFDPTTGILWGSAGAGTAGSATVDDGIYTINQLTGAGVLVGTTGFGGSTPDLVFDALGNLYGSKGGGPGGLSNLIQIDKTTGAGTLIGAIGFGPVSGMGSFEFTAVDVPQTPARSAHLEFLPPYPNPFSGQTAMRFTLPVTGQARLEVFDVAGRKVATLANGRLEAGPHVIPFDGTQLASGVYFSQLQYAGTRKVQKLVLVR